MKGKEHTTTDIMVESVDFVQRGKSSAVQQALQAVKVLNDSISLERELRLPVLDETRAAILELEDQIVALKLALLRSHHPDQLPLPLEDPVAKEGEQKASHRGDIVVTPALLSNALGS